MLQEVRESINTSKDSDVSGAMGLRIPFYIKYSTAEICALVSIGTPYDC